MANTGEASVEEILESIKRVMERDSRDSAAEARQRLVSEAEKAGPAQTDNTDDGVLDLAELELAEIVDRHSAKTTGP